MGHTRWGFQGKITHSVTSMITVCINTCSTPDNDKNEHDLGHQFYKDPVHVFLKKFIHSLYKYATCTEWLWMHFGEVFRSWKYGSNPNSSFKNSLCKNVCVYLQAEWTRTHKWICLSFNSNYWNISTEGISASGRRVPKSETVDVNPCICDWLIHSMEKLRSAHTDIETKNKHMAMIAQDEVNYNLIITH